MSARVTALGAAIWGIAFCKPLTANTLNAIDNAELRRYTQSELQHGTWSLQVPARAIYRDALGSLTAGDRDAARRKLRLAAQLSGDYPDPLFTLSRIELAAGRTEALPLFFEGIRRSLRGFYNRALLAANLVILAIAAGSAVLLLVLATLLARHWSRFTHLLEERWTPRFAFPPARLVAPLIILGLAILRAGAAIYTALMLAVLWPMLGRREKAAVAPLAALLGLLSLLAPHIESALVPALDEYSITRRLTLLGERGADMQLLASFERLDDSAFAAEREYALGVLHYRFGRLEEARQHLLACVALRADFAPAYMSLGNVYFREGDFSRALDGYRGALALNSTNAVAYHNIGQAHINLMLFAESSAALRRARELGIEEYLQAHPAARILDLDIYDSGLPAAELWSIAKREGRAGGGTILDGIFRPWFLVPLDRLWIVLAAGLAAGILLAAQRNAFYSVSPCDNCGRPTCPACRRPESPVDLCRGCSAVIGGLSSSKVMEALLRHRRQKLREKRARGAAWMSRILPGSAQILFGRPAKGVLVMTVAAAALLLIVWSGGYLDDPRRTGLGTRIWIMPVPALALALCWLATLTAKRPEEQVSYRILPPDFRPAQVEDRNEKGGQAVESRAEPAATDRQFAEFLDSL